MLDALLLMAAWDGPPGPNADWYRSLRQPDTGILCCSVADCRPVQFRDTPAGYEAYIDKGPGRFDDSAPNDWVKVPPGTVLHGHDNPTGQGIACWTHGIFLCFVRGSET